MDPRSLFHCITLTSKQGVPRGPTPGAPALGTSRLHLVCGDELGHGSFQCHMSLGFPSPLHEEVPKDHERIDLLD